MSVLLIHPRFNTRESKSTPRTNGNYIDRRAAPAYAILLQGGYKMTNNTCELCASSGEISPFEVPASPAPAAVSICQVCTEAMDAPTPHWQCLTTSMWSETPAIQVMAYRLLQRQSGEAWAQEALDMLYLDEETMAWAEAGVIAATVPTRDSNGTILQAGDTVTLIKDLPVKGAGFTAKRGTSVRGISLTDNPEHIEGRVNGQRIVLVSAYLKKSS